MIKVKDIVEVFTDYKKTSLLVVANTCDFKCEKEGFCDIGVCQNSNIIKNKTIKYSIKKLIKNFNHNILVEAIILGGLEPFLQFEDIYSFIKEFRKTNTNDIVIFTGYYPNEIKEEIKKLKEFSDIIIKFGRFIQDSKPIYSSILGVELASENQFAKRIEDL